MATYNGARFVERQLQSILEQLGPDDEVVVVDDHSGDDTVIVIQALDDPRIRLLTSAKNQGHIATFERALRNARGHFIFLSDQDDEWAPHRVQTMMKALSGAKIVASNWLPLGGARELDIRLKAADSHHSGKNLMGLFLGTAPYFGCGMALRRDALDVLLPFPRATEAHDHWIAIAGNVGGGLVHLEDVSVFRRIHDHNLTPLRRRRVPLVLLTRARLSLLVVIAARRRLALSFTRLTSTLLRGTR